MCAVNADMKLQNGTASHNCGEWNTFEEVELAVRAGGASLSLRLSGIFPTR